MNLWPIHLRRLGALVPVAAVLAFGGTLALRWVGAGAVWLYVLASVLSVACLYQAFVRFLPLRERALGGSRTLVSRYRIERQISLERARWSEARGLRLPVSVLVLADFLIQVGAIRWRLVIALLTGVVGVALAGLQVISLGTLFLASGAWVGVAGLMALILRRRAKDTSAKETHPEDS